MTKLAKQKVSQAIFMHLVIYGLYARQHFHFIINFVLIFYLVR